jgi:DnaJ-domain-containing protein 1
MFNVFKRRSRPAATMADKALSASPRWEYLAAMCFAVTAAVRRHGPMSKHHVRLIREPLTNVNGLDAEGVAAMRGFLKNALDRPLDATAFDPAMLAAKIAAEIGPARMPDFFEFVVGVVTWRLTALPPSGAAYLQAVAGLYGVSPPELERMIAKHLYKPAHDPRLANLRTLGLPANATLDDVKRAYRALIKQTHPDIAGHASTSRFLQIQRAYEGLMGEA